MRHENGVAGGFGIVWEDIDGSRDVFGEEEVEFGVVVVVAFVVVVFEQVCVVFIDFNGFNDVSFFRRS